MSYGPRWPMRIGRILKGGGDLCGAAGPVTVAVWVRKPAHLPVQIDIVSTAAMHSRRPQWVKLRHRTS